MEKPERTERAERLAHERLKAWELCHELVLRLYQASEHWPKEERYGITSQIRSAAVSTASNIAEGAAKHGPKETWGF